MQNEEINNEVKDNSINKDNLVDIDESSTNLPNEVVDIDSTKKVDMPGTKKAAIFLMNLGDEVSGEIFKNLTMIEQEKILVEIASPGQISPEVRAGVMDEFYELMQAQGIYLTGGWGKVESILNAAYGGKGRAKDMTDRLQSVINKQPFNAFRDTDPTTLHSFLRDESAQTIALILSYLPSEQSAEVLRKFRSPKRNEIAKRIATLSNMDQEAVRQVEEVLSERIGTGPGEQWSREGPVILAQILNRSSRDLSELVMDYIVNRGGPDGPEIAQQVKDNMFTFRDITLLNDIQMSIQVMRQVDDQELATALRGEPEEVVDKFRRNTPERRWNRIESLMKGPSISRGEINEAQRNIIDKIRDLEEAGEITIVRSTEEMVD